MSECKDCDQNLKIEQMFSCRVLVRRSHLWRAFLHASFPVHAHTYPLYYKRLIPVIGDKVNLIMKQDAVLCKNPSVKSLLDIELMNK